MKRILLKILLSGALLNSISPDSHAALTLDDALAILSEQVLQPSGDTNAVKVLMSPAPLASGIVEPMFGAPPSIEIASISGNPQWFAFVDLDPCAFFEHDVIYAFIDDVTGVVTTNAASDWPQIDGVEFGDGAGPGQKLIRVHPLVPYAGAIATATNDVDSPGAYDFGDAPDGEGGYNFPTRFATSNSVYALPGGYALPTTFMLGNNVSLEHSAVDNTTDEDAIPNLIDRDLDERMYLAIDPNTAIPTARLIFDATSISNESVFLNFLADVDRDGSWSNNLAADNWLIEDANVPLAAGTHTYLSGAFSWAGGVDDFEPLWVRVSLSLAMISTNLPITDWDGSGYIGDGEIEDFFMSKCPSGGGGGEPPEFEPKKTPPPGPQFGWTSLPIHFFALVIQGPDHKTQTAAQEAGEAMYKTLKAQGYDIPPIVNGANATAANIATEIAKIKAKVVCQDHILIYFIAHGKKETPGGQMALAEAYTGADLDAALDQIPPCEDEICNTPSKCCDVSVMIESCYSGQFISSSTNDGRGIFTASSATEPAHFGADGSGGQYSDGYAQGAAPGSGADNNPADGIVTPEELHDYSAARSKQQTEQKSTDYCDCLCPTSTWDCVRSIGGEGVAFPSGFGFFGAPVGSSFPGMETGIPLSPGDGPVYDLVPVDTYPNEWGFEMAVFNNDFMQTNFFQVFVQGLDTNTQLVVPMPMWIGNPFNLPPQPFHMQIDLFLDQFQIMDNAGTNLMNGTWSNYPQLLTFGTGPFVPAGLERANFLSPQPVQIQIEELGLQSEEPIMVLNWNAQKDSHYDIYISTNLTDHPFEPYETNLDNTTLFVPTHLSDAYFEVKPYAWP